MSAAATIPSIERSQGVSVTEEVFETLLAAIVSGDQVPGSRLPAERDLSQQLGASRSALREAIRRLTAWRLVEPRRGSGVVVRDPREWSIEVLPSFVRITAASEGLQGLKRVAPLFLDLLQIRKTVLAEVITMTAGRIPKGGLDRTRALLKEAWEVRRDPVQFVSADFRMMRSVVEAAEMMPAVWMLNSVAGVYLGIAQQVSFGATVAEDYLEVMDVIFTALERGEGEAASRRLEAYLERHDRRLLTILEGLMA